MGLLQIVSAGVVQGNTLSKVFRYSKKNNFAIPSINVINTESINAALESASYSHSAIMIQISHENAKNFSGKVQKGDANILGTVLVANHVHLTASSYKVPVILSTDYVDSTELLWVDELLKLGYEYHKIHGFALYSTIAIDLSSLTYEKSLKTAKKYLKKTSKIGMGLEVKIAVDHNNLKEVCDFYEELQKISMDFLVSLVFSDDDKRDKKMHFSNLQKLVETTLHTKSKPLNIVFDGDFCNKKDIREIINTGVVKINLNEEIKNAFCSSLDTLYHKYKEPKKCLRDIQKTIVTTINSSIKDYNAKNSI